MPLLHDPAVRESIRARVQTLSPSSTHKWGTMSVDQMLWHVNRVLANALGEFKPADMKLPIPKGMAKFMVLNFPWIKSAPTAPEFVAGERYSFEAERVRCLGLIDDFAKRGIADANWGYSATFGQITGRDWSRLNAKHLDHHLKQFGA